MRSTITPSVTEELEERQLRAPGAWWFLGSSALEPHLATLGAAGPLAGLREAGL